MKNKQDFDNHSNQRNLNNDAYWQSRGEGHRPDDGDEKIETGDSPSKG
jgi:hypothetical protein